MRRAGGLTAERRTFREQLRLQAAERFEQGEDNAVIAYDLRGQHPLGTALANGLNTRRRARR
jgi:hypothetical protein